MIRIHVLQHVPFENPGTILTWAHDNGCSVTTTRLYESNGGAVDFPDQTAFDWLIVMGGPMNIYEEGSYPWLVAEKTFIKASIESEKTVLGFCLGAQLIAAVLGGTVTQNPDKEIGWFPVFFSEEARMKPCFSSFPDKPTVFQWHGDTFSTLPPKAVLIAENDVCRNQAFTYGDRVFAFQFHLEMTKQIIEDLCENCADDMTPGWYVQSPEEMLEKGEYMLEKGEYMNQGNEWMDDFLSALKAEVE